MREDRWGKFFGKKKYIEKKLPTFEKVKDHIPMPIYDEEEGFIKLYYKSWKLAFKNMYQPSPRSGFVSDYFDAAFSDNIFLWDTSFMTMFGRYIHHIFPAIESFDNLYVKQHETGEICREINQYTGKDIWINTNGDPMEVTYAVTGFKDGKYKRGTYKWIRPSIDHSPPSFCRMDALNHPILIWAEYMSLMQTGDVERIHLVYPPLKAYYKAMQNYVRDHNGLYITDWASMDNSPRNYFEKNGVLTPVRNGVDTASEMVLFGRYLPLMAGLLGIEEDQLIYQKEAEQLAKLINGKMWDDKKGFYFDLDIDGDRIPIKTVSGFWPLIAGIASKDQVKALIRELHNERTFSRLHMIPSASADAPNYVPEGGYWRGSVWPPINTMIIYGLTKYALFDEAKRIAMNHLDNVYKVYLETNTIWENYAPDYIKPGKPAKPDFAGWSAIGPINYLMEYAIGLDAFALKNKLLWHLESPERVGCKNYWFNNNMISLLAEEEVDNGRNIFVNASKSFMLEIAYKGKSINIDVKKGRNRYKL